MFLPELFLGNFADDAAAAAYVAANGWTLAVGMYYYDTTLASLKWRDATGAWVEIT